MARSPSTAARPLRKRRTAEEARSAILDAAERRLVEAGPGGIRLQEVAADVGVSHPTVLHHFGSREALVEAVVARAHESLLDGLVAAVREAPEGEGQVAALLDGAFEALKSKGHGRAFLWVALAGYGAEAGELRLRQVAEVVHELRRKRRAGRKKMPPLEDTQFTVTLAALALLGQSVLGSQLGGAVSKGDDARAEARFRAWLARLIIEHFDGP